MAKQVSADKGQRAVATDGGAPAPSFKSGNELLRDAVKVNDLSKVKALLLNGADPNYQPTSGFDSTTFYQDVPTWAIAAKHGYENVLVALMKAGGNPNLQQRLGTYPDGWVAGTALYYAVFAGRLNIARILLRYGADPNLIGYGLGITSTFSPLMRACQNHSEELVVALLEAGADPNAALDDGRTAHDFWAGFDAILKRRSEAKAMMESREILLLDKTRADKDPLKGERPRDIADIPLHVTDNIRFMLGARPNPVPNSASRGLAFAHIIL